ECRRRGWVYVHSNPTKKATNRPGTPDFIIYASNGHVLNVECKTAAGRLSKEQQKFRADIAKLGHVYHIVRAFNAFEMIAEIIAKE
ncbi:MAG: VRR-NUC domain-containing protein, partial [Patescibacteria group bacterium]|nr:VRR-NUC domain-containing protein [Patescibacteria group bacterium]